MRALTLYKVLVILSARFICNSADSDSMRSLLICLTRDCMSSKDSVEFGIATWRSAIWLSSFAMSPDSLAMYVANDCSASVHATALDVSWRSS